MATNKQDNCTQQSVGFCVQCKFLGLEYVVSWEFPYLICCDDIPQGCKLIFYKFKMLSPAIITLIGVLLSMFANTVTLVLIMFIFALRRSKLSAHFAINLHTWILANSLDILYLGYIAVFWRGEGKCLSIGSFYLRF